MNKRKKIFSIADNVAGLIADVMVAVFLIALSAALLIFPGLVVFVQGHSGFWLFLTYIGFPLMGYFSYNMIKHVGDDVRRLKR